MTRRNDRYAAIDTSDGAGMNMMDLKEQKWSADVLNATADGLAAKLEPVVPAHTALGGISQYFIQEYVLTSGTSAPPFPPLLLLWVLVNTREDNWWWYTVRDYGMSHSDEA